MTIYHVDLYYRKNDVQDYGVMPYSLKGMMKYFLGGCYRPRYKGLIDFIKWLCMGKLSESAANRLVKKKNEMLLNR